MELAQVSACAKSSVALAFKVRRPCWAGEAPAATRFISMNTPGDGLGLTNAALKPDRNPALFREAAGAGIKGRYEPTPAFRLLRVGAELCVNELQSSRLSG